MTIDFYNFFPTQRPYSQDEIADLRKEYHRLFNLSNHLISHTSGPTSALDEESHESHGKRERHTCSDFYLAVLGSKKYNSRNDPTATGGCSVCWKLRNTEKEEDMSICNNYMDDWDRFYNGDREYTKEITVQMCHSEILFYNWLYGARPRRNTKGGKRAPRKK